MRLTALNIGGISATTYYQTVCNTCEKFLDFLTAYILIDLNS